MCVCVSVTNLVEQAHTIADHDRTKPYGERERREGRERERGGGGREGGERDGGGRERERRENEKEGERDCVWRVWGVASLVEQIHAIADHGRRKPYGEREREGEGRGGGGGGERKCVCV